MSDEEKIVNWFESNYKSLVLGIVIGLTILFSYKSFLSSQNSKQLELSRSFDLAVQSFHEGNTEQIISFTKLNMTENADNIYTSLASMYSAKAMYINNKLNESKFYYDHIIENSNDMELINLAIYRKAKILIEQKEYDGAHALLGEDITNYQHIELKGDIYYIQKDDQNARDYYNQALLYEITPNERKNIQAKINLLK